MEPKYFKFKLGTDFMQKGTQAYSSWARVNIYIQSLRMSFKDDIWLASSHND